ncbi:uncharacterized protein N7506_005294 [Penicillium brevicompactum]|uniref:uncharacterized protein n=1 Tax=Penicillium brevicompactum TaxID=5074 RepID=UPI002540BFB7|nr:uncharacterized protein N7506_005294 [Penicillium brevicompactum]KAJ5337272.1 hypothetical protein N7506_005294 [Penicillium brevicompactum]
MAAFDLGANATADIPWSFTQTPIETLRDFNGPRQLWRRYTPPPDVWRSGTKWGSLPSMCHARETQCQARLASRTVLGHIPAEVQKHS